MTEDEKAQILSSIPGRLPQGAPERPRSRKSWHDNQWRAAALRARGVAWQTIADCLSVSLSTVTKYTTKLDGFAELVEFFEAHDRSMRLDRWIREEEELVLAGTREALEAILAVVRGEPDHKGEKPSMALRTNTAFKFLRIVGYEEAKNQLARAQVAQMLEDPEAQNQQDNTSIDPRIEYGDEDEYIDAEYE